jgi:hypothetical protein
MESDTDERVLHSAWNSQHGMPPSLNGPLQRQSNRLIKSSSVYPGLSESSRRNENAHLTPADSSAFAVCWFRHSDEKLSESESAVQNITFKNERMIEWFSDSLKQLF